MCIRDIHWDIGKVYKRLIKAVAEHEKIGIIEALFKVYNSFLSTKIDDYNSSMYYEMCIRDRNMAV